MLTKQSINKLIHISHVIKGSTAQLFSIRYNFSLPKNPNTIYHPKLQQYQSIKQKQTKKSKITNSSSPLISSIQIVQQQYPKQQVVQKRSQYRCDGCNVFLQWNDNKKYGYILEKVYKQAITQNTQIIQQTYGERANSGDAKVLDFLHQIQKQTNITIFEDGLNQMKNLDNVAVLLMLQQKIDKYQQQNQTLKRSKKHRKQLLCFRCHSLKYHNHLPSEYDDQIYQGGLNLDREFVLNKVFSRHKQTSQIHYLFVIDAMDVFGTLREDLVWKLVQKDVTFSIVINKYDVINQKYLAQNFLHQEVKKLLRQYLTTYQQQLARQTQYHNFQAEEKLKQIKIFFVSSVSRQGVKKIEQFMLEGLKKIQLFGLPNTGKTTLLNKLVRSDKITSKIPGTTIRISQHIYRNRIRIYDMPGLHYPDLLYNLISKPSLKALLTWSKIYSPPLLTHSCFIYGGKIQAEGLRIIPFGLGGSCSSDNAWFLTNYKEFWKGLGDLQRLKMVKHHVQLVFQYGRAQDLEIAGYGFVGFKPCIKSKTHFTQKITFYLPEKVKYRLRTSVLLNNSIFHNKSAFSKRYQLQRIQKDSMALRE